MNELTKQIIIIIFISLVLSVIRYLFIMNEYTLIKENNKINSENIVSNNYDLESLKEFIYKVKNPRIIDIKLAKYIFEYELATFIDARDMDSFNEEHIENAINLSYEDFIENIDKEYLKESLELGDVEEYETFSIGTIDCIPFIGNLERGELEKDVLKNKVNKTVFVIYCSGIGCSLSEDLALYLYEEFQFNHLLVFEGGMPVWKENQLPTE